MSAFIMIIKPDLALQSVVLRLPILETEVDGEVVALDIGKGHWYGLNKTGSAIWNMIAAPLSVDAICTQLLATYEIDRATCERQVRELLLDLLRNGLIELIAPDHGA